VNKEEGYVNQKIVNCNICNDLYWVAPVTDADIAKNQDVSETEKNKVLSQGAYASSVKYSICECVKETTFNKQRKGSLETQDLGDLTTSMIKKMTFNSFKIDSYNSGSDLLGIKGAVEEFYKESENSGVGFLILHGKTGVGKTHLAVSIAGKRLKSFLPVFFGFMPNILERLRNFNSNSYNHVDFLQFLIEHPYLIIDDLGSQINSAWAEEKIYQIIVGRHNSNLPTIITTRAEDIEKDLVFNNQIGEAIKSRLLNSENDIFEMIGPDYRKKGL